MGDYFETAIAGFGVVVGLPVITIVAIAAFPFWLVAKFLMLIRDGAFDTKETKR